VVSLYHGRWDVAKELEVQVMDTGKKKLGANHPDTLTRMANLALTYQDQGQWDAAEELFVQVIIATTSSARGKRGTCQSVWRSY
jgi:hypothetical protein